MREIRKTRKGQERKECEGRLNIYERARKIRIKDGIEISAESEGRARREEGEENIYE